MTKPTISGERVLAALARASQVSGNQGRAGLAELSMDELAAAAGVSRATLYRLFGSQQNLLRDLGLEPSQTVRSRILETALDLVGRDGLAELSMDELAATAGVSRATLYRLFPGKVALFTELVRIHSPFEAIATVLETGRDRPPAEVVPLVAQAMARSMDGRVGLLLQLLFELSRSDADGTAGPDPRDAGHRSSGPGSEYGMRTIPLVVGYLSEQMAAGRLRRMDPLLAFQALAGPIVMHLLARPRAAAAAGSQAGALAGAAAGKPPELAEAVEEFAGIWLRALAPADGEEDAGPSKPRRN
jgi:AcrR family transcriptional regulator